MKVKNVVFITAFVFIVSCTADDLLLFESEEVEEYYYPNSVFTIKSGGNTIYGMYLPSSATDDITNVVVLFCHGNAKSMNHYIPQAMFFHDIGVQFVMFDYRGYGKSEGETTEEGTYEDAEAVLNYILTHLTNLNTNNIFYVGYSLGGAVATELALRHKPRGLILVSTFTSMDDMVEQFTSYDIPAKWVLSSKYETINKIDKIGVPLLIAHGTEDSSIPIELGRELFDRAKEPKRFYEVEEADHGDVFQKGASKLQNAIKNFIQDVITNGM